MLADHKLQWFNYPSSFPTERTKLKVKPVKPDFLLKDVEELDAEELHEMGVRGILYDLERTLIPIGSREIPKETRLRFLWFMNDQGFEQAVCTNSSYHYTHFGFVTAFRSRIAQPDAERGISKKPDFSIFQEGIRLLELPPEEILMVGDKLLFDTSPAAALGMKTALVNPMPGKDVWAEYLAFRRTREKLALHKLGVKRP